MPGGLIKITAILNKDGYPGLIEELEAAGISKLDSTPGRSSVLGEKKGLLGLFSGGSNLTDQPVDILSFVVDDKHETDMISLIAEKGKLHLPGMGSVFSEEVAINQAHPLLGLNEAKTLGLEKPENIYTELSGICCIVQRGQGDAIAQVVLESGACVPTITFGIGTGVRDKLGLLRITIPAEKEVLTLILSSYDVDAVMDLMIKAGDLDQPGRGFIHVFPVRQGIVNTKLTHGSSGQAANMEQIISAIDGLKESIEWRRRGAEPGKIERNYLRDMVDFSLLCDAGRGSELVKAAMKAGATGATISKNKFVIAAKSTSTKNVSPAREICNMCVGQNQVQNIIDSIAKVGAFDDKTHGEVITSPVPRAFTFLGEKPKPDSGEEK